MSEAIRLSRRASTERTLHGPAVTAATVAGAAVPQVAVKVRGMASPGFAGSAVVLNQQSLPSDKNLLWPTADKKRSWSAKSAACLGGFRGQRRTGAVIRGHNPVALAACSPRPPERIGGVPRPKADKMEALAELAENAEENVGNHQRAVVS